MVNKSKNMEVKEMTKPNIINGLDFTFSSFLGLFLEDTKLLFFLERRFTNVVFPAPEGDDNTTIIPPLF